MSYKHKGRPREVTYVQVSFTTHDGSCGLRKEVDDPGTRNSILLVEMRIGSELTQSRAFRCGERATPNSSRSRDHPGVF